jgi:hypothetical protein
MVGLLTCQREKTYSRSTAATGREGAVRGNIRIHLHIILLFVAFGTSCESNYLVFIVVSFSLSDEHEVDVIGINFGRHHVGGSDDDRSSVRSSGSDGSNGSGSGGVAITSWTRQLTIGVAGMAEHSANAIQVQTA